jgi:hypothetical protein
MIDAKTENLLHKIVRREGRSFLQYVSEAFPWTTAEERAPLSQLQKLIAEEREATGRLMEFLARRSHTYPYLGSYPTGFTNFGYISLEHLLPMLVEYEGRSLGELECDLAEITDTEVLALVQDMVDMKRRHLDVLKKMAAAHPETQSTMR